MPKDSKTRDFDIDLLPDPIAVEDTLDNQALVIGIDSYEDGIPRLTNAVADAMAIAGVLRQDYNFTVTTLLNEDADKSQINSFLELMLNSTTNTRWLFFFAGHGMTKDGQGYLLPQDALRNQNDSYLSLSRLLKQARVGNSRELLLIIDACYSGQALITPSEFSDLIPSDIRGSRVVQAITSGNPDQPVLDSGGRGNSIFTQALWEALEGWIGIHDTNGVITFSDLLSFLKQEVKNRLMAEGHSAWSQQVIGGNLIGNRSGMDFAFKPIKPRLDSAILQQSRDPRPTWRIQAIERLPLEFIQNASRQSTAFTLAAAHVRRQPGANAFSVVTPGIYYEPDARVRACAAAALGKLGDLKALDPLQSALEDENIVCQAAAASLVQLKDARASGALLQRLYQAPSGLFLDLVKAIFGLGDPVYMVTALVYAYQTGCLVPFIGPNLPQTLTGLPERATIADHLAEDFPVKANGSLVLAAEASMAGGSSRYTFTQFLGSVFRNSYYQPGPLFQAFMHINAPIWLYANYDDLLANTINAQTIVSGADTDYWQPERRTVISLLGSADKDITKLVVLEEDYLEFRSDEKDRQKLVNFIHDKIDQKIVLMLGFDPDSRDFSYLVNGILNFHLQQATFCPVIVWEDEAIFPEWGSVPLFPLQMETMKLIERIIPKRKNPGENQDSHNEQPDHLDAG